MHSPEVLKELTKLLGPNTMFLPAVTGGTTTTEKGWQKLPLPKTQTSQYQLKLLKSNIAVATGHHSSHIVSINLDTDEAAEQFLAANPDLTDTLRTRGSRGCSIWLRMDGPYPQSAKIVQCGSGDTVGWWQASGTYTVIHGTNSKGTLYKRAFDGPVKAVAYESIIWPALFQPEERLKALQKVAGRPFLSSVFENRRRIACSMLEGVTWITETEAHCFCPGKSAHTKESQREDCRVVLSGIPRIECLHSSCAGQIKSVNESLRKAVRRQEFLLLPDGDVPAPESAEQLFAILGDSNRFYFRGGEVCEVVSGVTGPQLKRVDKVRAISAFEKYIGFAYRKVKEGEEYVQPCTLPENVAAMFLQSDGPKLLPLVDNVVTIPILYQDGSGKLLVHNNGYNAQTRTYVANPDPSKPLPEVSLKEATDLLLDLLADFDFDGDGHRSRALASFITPAMVFSGLLGGRPPVDVAEADQSQAGKNFRHKLVCYIYGETPRPIMQRKGGVGSLDESLAEALISGKPFPQLDNLRGRLDSPQLESFLTADKTSTARGFGRGEMTINVERFCTMLTSNNLQFTQDLANRCSIVRIRKKPDGYVWRDYGGLRLDEYVKLNQSRYLAAVYRIVQTWYSHGRCESHRDGDHHDFRWWSGRMGWIIENLFPGQAPLLEGHRSVQMRAGDARLGWLQQVAFEAENQGLTDTPLRMSGLRDLAIDGGFGVYRNPGQENKAFINDEAELRFLSSVLHPLFSRGDLELDGFIVRKSDIEVERDSNGTIYKARAYTFRQSGRPLKNGGNSSKAPQEQFADTERPYGVIPPMLGENPSDAA